MLKLWFIIIATVAVSGNKLKTVFEWKYIDFDWESNSQKLKYINEGNYIYQNIVPIDVDKSRDGRIFISFIRDEGVPASLGIITKKLGVASGPLVKPYPNWSWFNRTDCSGITSVYRVYIDDCNSMYVLDNGYVGEKYTCPAKILRFDLATDRLIDRLIIPHDVSHNKDNMGRLVTPVVQTSGPDCQLNNIFIADPVGRALVIWNGEKFTRLEGEAFMPIGSLSEVTIENEKFTLNDSLIGLAVSQQLFRDEGRKLIFRPFASHALYSSDTRVLERSYIGDAIRFRMNKEFLPSQASNLAISMGGTLFLGLTTETAIGCWNRYRNMNQDNFQIIAKDSMRLQFISGMKVLPCSRSKKEELWMLSNRFQKIMARSMKYSEVNFRIVKAKVDDLVHKTKCEPPKKVIKSKYLRC